MSGEQVHEFHFIIDRKRKERLQDLEFYRKSKSFSGVIVEILKLLSPVMSKECKWGDQRMSKYMSVCDDSEEIREHIHMYIPGEMYRELKLLHHSLNFFSIAQLVRWLVDLFLGFVDVFKDKVLTELEKIFNSWKSDDEAQRLTSRKFIRQLWKIIRFLPGKNRLITVYNKNYSPFWVLRI